MTGHPSEYALDRAALGARVDASLGAHLAACARCAGIVASRRAPAAPPDWLAPVVVRPARPPRRLPWRWLVPAVAVAASAVLLVVIRPEPSRSPAPDGIRGKGTPHVTVYVKRGEHVRAWDGRTPLRPGDRLRVGVRGAGYAALSIASLSPPGPPTLLYSGPLEHDAETLPALSFRVEGRGGGEVLSVILSMRPVPLAEHEGRPDRRGEDGVWGTRFVIPKEEVE